MSLFKRKKYPWEEDEEEEFENPADWTVRQELVRQQDQRRNGYKYFGRGWDNRTNRYHLSR